MTGAGPPGAHRRAGVAVALVALAALVAAGCGGSRVKLASASMRSEPRPSAASEELPGLEELPDLDELPGLEELPDLDELPGMEELPGMDELPELEGLGDCTELFFAYTELVTLALAGGDAAEIDRVVGELADQLPEELGDDLEVVRDTLTEAAEGGLLDAAGSLTGQAFIDANEAITGWLVTECAGVEGERS